MRRNRTKPCGKTLHGIPNRRSGVVCQEDWRPAISLVFIVINVTTRAKIRQIPN
jgi:hypothetical protein